MPGGRIVTQVGADQKIRLRDLPLKGHERIFFERVPLTPEQRARIELRDEWRYAALAEAVEAWGFRAVQDRRELMTRAEVADAWFRSEYEPVVELLREADLVRGGTETESYMRVAHLRYLLLHYHGNVALALAAYNAGEGKVDEWWQEAAGRGESFRAADHIPFAETRDYVTKVLDARREYRRTYAAELGYR